MNDEIEISKLEEREIKRLYDELSEKDPSSEEYQTILAHIIKIRDAYNDNSKIEQAYWTAEESRQQDKAFKEEELKQRRKEMIIKAAEYLLGTGLSVATTWLVLKTNIKFGPISTKEAWNEIKKIKLLL